MGVQGFRGLGGRGLHDINLLLYLYGYGLRFGCPENLAGGGSTGRFFITSSIFSVAQSPDESLPALGRAIYPGKALLFHDLEGMCLQPRSVLAKDCVVGSRGLEPR